MLRVYGYKNCGTCKKAIKWLQSHKIKFEEIEAMLKVVAREAEKPLHEIGDSFRKLAHDLRVGYDRVRELI